MKTHFHIGNKRFVDYLKVTTNGKTYYFCDDLTVEYDDCENLEVDIELIKATNYFNIKSKNPILKWFVRILRFILSPLIFFIDNEDGIGFHKGYYSFNPFTHKQTVLINSPNERIINIGYTDARYNKTTKKFSSPVIKIKEEDVIVKSEETRFSEKILKQEWNVYHVPAYIVLIILVLLINAVNFLVCGKAIFKDFEILSFLEISGIVFCSTVIIGLFVLIIVGIVRSRRYYKEVIEINT